MQIKCSSSRQLTGFLGADQQPIARRPVSSRVVASNLDEVVRVWPHVFQPGVVPFAGHCLGFSLTVFVAPPVPYLEPKKAPLSVWMITDKCSSDFERESPGNHPVHSGRGASTKRWRLWQTRPCRRSWLELQMELRGQKKPPLQSLYTRRPFSKWMKTDTQQNLLCCMP